MMAEVTRDSLAQVFDSWKDLKVLVIGDVMIDAYYWGGVERISPEAPVPVVNVKQQQRKLGGSANVAYNVRQLGASPLVLSVLGDDAGADQFCSLLTEADISDQYLLRSKNRKTTVKTRIISGKQQMLRVDEESLHYLSEAEEQELYGRVEGLIGQVDVLIFEDYDKGVLSESLVRRLVKLANEHEVITTVDPKKNSFFAYEGVSLFKPNLKELKEGLKIDLPVEFNLEAVKDAVEQLRNRLGAEMVMTTLSENGVLICGEDESHHMPAHKRKIYDVSGAGDTVISVASLALASGLPVKWVAALANLAGGLVCEHVGVVAVDKGRLQQEALGLLF